MLPRFPAIRFSPEWLRQGSPPLPGEEVPPRTQQNQLGKVADQFFAFKAKHASWALDMYSREGRAALNAFLQGDSETALWVRAHVPAVRRVNFLGTVVFRVEGQLCLQRLRWPVADELRRMVDIECNGPHCADATEILNLMWADIPVLNGVRADVMQGVHHVG